MTIDKSMIVIFTKIKRNNKKISSLKIYNILDLKLLQLNETGIIEIIKSVNMQFQIICKF